MRFRQEALELFWLDPTTDAPRDVPMDILKVLYRKLQLLDSATSIQDLRVPPGNHLERLKGDRAGQYSIRVNKQWRLCFVWVAGEAREVEFCDYH